MPVLLSLNMCAVSAVGSLAMQASRRWWAASLASALLVASPLAGYGVVQQLMPQVWGLGLAVGLVSWLMRPEMHRRPGLRIRDVLVVAILTVSLFTVYVELGASLLGAYGIYVVWLAMRRGLTLRAVALLWAAPVMATALVVNLYLPYMFRYIQGAASFGVSAPHAAVRLFAYSLVPTALPGITGLQELFSPPTTPGMTISIAAAAVLLTGLLVVCVLTARRGAAAALVLLGDTALAVLLAVHVNDFGLFKLYMYAQPFIAAAVGAWLPSLRTRTALAAAFAALLVVMGVQVSRLNAYVAGSRNPVDLPYASEPSLLPAFRELLRSASEPVVSATDKFCPPRARRSKLWG